MAETNIAGETLQKAVQRRLSAMERERQSFDAHWRDIAQYLMPRRGKFFDYERDNRGRKKHQKIVNSAALKASRTLASGMNSGLTSQARPWFRLTVSDPDLADFWRVRAWLDTVAQRMRDILARSNFYNVLQPMYAELGVFASAPIIMLEHALQVVRFYPFTIGSYYIAQDNELKIDSFARRFTWTLTQMEREYGLDAMTRAQREAFKRGHLEQTANLVQLIERRREYIPGYADARGMPWRSIVIDTSADDPNKPLEDRGFHEFPVLCSRWETMTDTPWGSNCPGMEALGDVRSLQYHEIRSAAILDSIDKPALQAPGALQKQRVSLVPGEITYLPPTQGNNAKVEPVYTPDPRAFDFTMKKIGDIKQQINEAFYVDVFLMLDQLEGVQPRNQMELAQRKEEKMLALGPVLEQLNTDTFDPLIDRLFNIMVRRNMLPPIPPELSGWPLKVEYISVLAQAQKAVATGNMERFAAFAGQLASANPQVLDKVNFDQMIDDYADATGLPARQIASDDQVAAVRQQRAQQQNMMAAVASAPAVKQGVDALSKAASTTPAEDNMLTTLAKSGALGNLLGGAARTGS